MDLAELSESLPSEDRDALAAAMQPLLETLELAVDGKAPNGWSSEGVTTVVGGICERADLISWTVQP